MTSFTFPNEGLQYLNDAYRNVTISHTKYIILMIKNIFTYLHSLYTKIYLHIYTHYIQKYIYTIHIYIDLFTNRVEDHGHWDTMIRCFNRTLTKNLRNLVWEKKGQINTH